jgi:hypothetical protein
VTRRWALFILAGAWLALVAAAPANASHHTIRIGVYSQKASSGKVAIGASITVSDRRRGRRGGPPTSGDRDSDRGEEYEYAWPALSSDSPLLRDATPLGPDSFWYVDGSGNTCLYLPNSALPCYRVVSPQSGAPGLSPAAIAASVADRLELAPGQIVTSPPRDAAGLTGADSWFWLEPAPDREDLSVELAGVRVTVVAEPARVEWRFGDAASVRAGPGVPYRAGRPPEGSVRHRYETRCLPGDRGRNPYVLASCGRDGYRVEAEVLWQISFQATGRVAASGSLPARTTETAIDYPVSEARAFLVGGGSR